jgi:hypothetical protein
VVVVPGQTWVSACDLSVVVSARDFSRAELHRASSCSASSDTEPGSAVKTRMVCPWSAGALALGEGTTGESQDAKAALHVSPGRNDSPHRREAGQTSSSERAPASVRKTGVKAASCAARTLVRVEGGLCIVRAS